MKQTLRLPAPAKLNLMLRIVGRRADGYHLLQTVFQFIDRCDWLTFERRDDGVVRLNTPLPGVPPEADLTVRAARMLQRYGGVSYGVDMAIDKQIPLGGGLGGGSSDAATTLVGLNQLWNLGLPRQTLQELGLQLGADVPVFVFGRAAWAEGVGERLTPLALAEPWYVVVMPGCHVATGAVFGAPNLTRDHKPITLRDFLDGQHENHCLPVVCVLYPEVGAALEALSQFAPARLTGTGACVFAEFQTEAEAQGVAARLGAAWSVFVARGRSLSPLRAVVAEAG